MQVVRRAGCISELRWAINKILNDYQSSDVAPQYKSKMLFELHLSSELQGIQKNSKKRINGFWLVFKDLVKMSTFGATQEALDQWLVGKLFDRVSRTVSALLHTFYATLPPIRKWYFYLPQGCTVLQHHQMVIRRNAQIRRARILKAHMVFQFPSKTV